jgi:hypothetical protein
LRLVLAGDSGARPRPGAPAVAATASVRLRGTVKGRLIPGAAIAVSRRLYVFWVADAGLEVGGGSSAR